MVPAGNTVAPVGTNFRLSGLGVVSKLKNSPRFCCEKYGKESFLLLRVVNVALERVEAIVERRVE